MTNEHITIKLNASMWKRARADLDKEGKGKKNWEQRKIYNC